VVLPILLMPPKKEKRNPHISNDLQLTSHASDVINSATRGGYLGAGGIISFRILLIHSLPSGGKFCLEVFFWMGGTSALRRNSGQ